MKKHNALKVVLVTILVLLVLSWIFPAAYFSGEYIDQGRVQMGLFDLFNYPMTALAYFGFIGIYLILVGGFYGVLYKIPAYRTFLDKIVEKFKGKEMVFLALSSMIIALAVSFCGLQVGFALFIPLIISVILLMGYDKITAALIVAGSIAVGFAGTTYAYNNSSIILSTLSLKIDYQILVRFLILIVGVVLVVFNTYMYNKGLASEVVVEKKPEKKDEDDEEEEKIVHEEKKNKVVKTENVKKTNSSHSNRTNKNSTTKSKSTSKKTSSSRKNNNKAALMDEDVIVVKGKGTDSYLIPKTDSKEHKIWPFTVGFTLMFVLMVLAFISWGEGGFGVKVFNDITKSVTEFKLFDFPLFAKLLGTINAFGSWNLYDLFLPIVLLILLLAFIYNVKFDDVLDGLEEGAKKALAPATIALLVYTALVIATYHPFQLSIYKGILGLTKKFTGGAVVTTSFATILSGIFNSDFSYAGQSLLPYLVSAFSNADKHYALIGIISQSMYGLSMLFAPTGLGLMATLAYLNISYKDWLKSSWKLILEFLVILLIVFIILA